MAILDTPLKRFAYTLKERNIRQTQIAAAAGMSNGAISDMINKGKLSFRALVGLKKVDKELDMNWIVTGFGSMIEENTMKYEHGLIGMDQSKLMDELEEIKSRLTKLEERK